VPPKEPKTFVDCLYEQAKSRAGLTKYPGLEEAGLF
jgi:hypothetical protein